MVKKVIVKILKFWSPGLVISILLYFINPMFMGFFESDFENRVFYFYEETSLEKNDVEEENPEEDEDKKSKEDTEDFLSSLKHLSLNILKFVITGFCILFLIGFIGGSVDTLYKLFKEGSGSSSQSSSSTSESESESTASSNTTSSTMDSDDDL